ncbi:MAG: C40 family peptidase [Armatimonadota bacterium]
MKVKFFIYIFLIIFISSLFMPCFASPGLNIGFSSGLWEKSDEMSDLISAYNEKEKSKESSQLIKIHGSNDRGIRYSTNYNPSNGDGEVYIHRDKDGLIIKIHGTQDTITASKISRNPSLASRIGRIIQSAKSYLGVPYKWGGTTGYGFDCSGFTMTMFRKYGINIRRCADEQYYQGYYVSRSEMLPGDLVFFSTYMAGPSHVGIYLGGSKFIHASSRGGVKISSLNEAYYSSCYLGARRMW